MKGTKHRVLFQNADGSINLGIKFCDKNIDNYDLFWYSIVANAMESSLEKNEGLVCIDEKFKTKSCYVELHRKAFKYTAKLAVQIVVLIIIE